MTEFAAASVAPRLNVPVAPSERPVELVELHVSAEVSGALAVTTWELVFHNPNHRVLEGQLEFPLLDGQTVIRFAMDLDGHLREAVPVPKDKGRQVFEEIVRRGVDPGLLEKTAGNSYRARIYPLLPGQRKRVVIAYQEEAARRDGGQVYRLALDFPRLRRFTLEVAVRGPAGAPAVTHDTLGLSLPPWRQDFVTRVEKTDFTARGVLELSLPAGDRPAVTTEEFAGKTYFRAEKELALQTRPRPQPRVLGLLWDSSGSGDGRDLKREFAALDRWFKALAGPLEVRLVRLRDAAEPAEVFRVEKGEWSALRRALDQTCWDGATSLAGWTPEAGVDAWLFCSDGLFNFGAQDVRPDTRGAPIHVLLSAARSDPARLRDLADRSGGEFVDLLELSAETAVERLSHASERLLAVETSPREVAHVYPEAPAPLHGRLVVAGVLRAESATVRARIGFPDAPDRAREVEIEISGREPHGRLAARAWAALKIASLEPLHAINHADIERTGQEFGIVTRSTSLIILETVEDYARYDIVPPAELRPAWEQIRRHQWHARDEGRAGRIERVVGLFREYVSWYEREFIKHAGKPAKGDAADGLRVPVPPSSSTRTGSAPSGGVEELRRRAEEQGSPAAGRAAPRPASDAPSRAQSARPAPEPVAPVVATPVPSAPRPPMQASPRQEVSESAPVMFAEITDEDIDHLHDDAAPRHRGPMREVVAEVVSSGMDLMEAEEAAAPMADADEYAGEGGEAPAEPAKARAAIQLQKWSPDSPYLERLRRTPDPRLYHVYLEERPDYARSTAFFLDVADVFFERGMPSLALRVLSNLAEMDLENPAVLRILGYRLLQANRPELARPVFEQVRKLRPEEPQSHRDLAQACAAVGDLQAAIDLLWEVVTGSWDSRFPEIELLALIELNALIAASPRPLDVGRIDPRLRRALPLDLRVVLTWDADNTDIDLWVTDPNGERAYYGNRLTQQGGRMSPDFREGYGPEEFSLRRALPGQYTVEANFYGNRQQIIAGATTIQLQFITDFATPRAHEQRVTMRLRDTREVVTVGRFTVDRR